MTKNKTLIEITNLTMGFDQRLLFKNLNMTIDKGDFLSIIGPNGTGKSTFLHLLMKKLTPKGGKVTYIGPNFGPKQIGFVPQTRNIAEDYPLNIFSFVVNSKR